MEIEELNAVLAELDAAVAAGSTDVAATLRAGAGAAAITKLEGVVGELGPTLRAWFAWHDGQNGFKSFGPETNEQLQSVADVADDWPFLQGEARQPWHAEWVPIMRNGSGDYVVFDRRDGSLLRYYHDDDMRPRLAPSLAAWARAVAAEWRAAKGKKKTKK